MKTERSHRTLAALDKLYRACKNGDDEIIGKILKTVDLDVNRLGNDSKTALYHAITSGKVNAVRLLLEQNADVSKPCFVSYHRERSSVQLVSCDETALVTAARLGSLPIVKLLLEHKASVDSQSLCHSHIHGVHMLDRTALHFACEQHDVEMVRLLLNNGAAVNVVDKQQELPIHIAARCKSCSQQREILRMLCNHGSYVNTPNKIECPPLYLAAFYGCITKVEMLMEYGADANNVCERESSYGSALHIAALKDRVPLAELLIKSGAQLSHLNASHYTPLQLNMSAHNRSTIAKILIYHGAELDGEDKHGFSLMAACIRSVRLDCESLAKAMVYAGYNLNNDHWLRPAHDQEQVRAEGIEVLHIPIPAGRVEALCLWLRHAQANVLSLMQMCRAVVRQSISGACEGRSVVSGLNSLPLPATIIHFLLLKDIIDL